jgi:Na+-transporting methylmalonyl-CoA/oxaloacetate decarboxylase gamma subunit
VIVRSEGIGNYSFPARLGGISGHFAASDCITEFEIDSESSFIDVLTFTLEGKCGSTTTAIIDLSGPNETALVHLPVSSAGADPSLYEAESSTAVLIGVGSTLAVLLLIVGGIVLLVACGHRFKRSAPASTESESENAMPADDSRLSATIAAAVSEENALSADGDLTKRKPLPADDRDESRIASVLTG